MTIDLGNDTVFCPPYPDTAQVSNILGSNLIISGGQPPYNFEWSTEPYSLSFGNFTLYTSDYLNDSTIAQPALSGGRDTMQFYLTVTDANGQSATDSIIVYTPVFYIHLGYFIHHITLGDSVHLNCLNIDGGIGPLTYLWRPNHGLLDSTNASFWTKPEVNTAYYVTVTDSKGCKVRAGSGCIVVVEYLGIDDLLNSESLVTLSPNPTTGTILLKDEENITKNIQIYDAIGRFIADVLPSSFPYDLSSYAKGTYFFKIETEEGNETKTVVLE